MEFPVIFGQLLRANQTKKSYPLYHKPSFFHKSENGKEDSADQDKRLFFELEKEEYGKLSNTFKEVYPGIYEGLEKYWQDITRRWLVNVIEAKQNFTILICKSAFIAGGSL
jgi:hypothetical protein